jgi:lactam utilization protein B
MKARFQFSLLLIGTLLAACAYNISYVNTTYDLLAVSQSSYETTIKTVIDLHKQGRISDEDKAKVFEVGKQFAIAHNAAVEALAQYEESGMMIGQAQLEKQITAAAEALSSLLQIVKPYLQEN